MKNKYVFTAVLLAMILFVGSVLTMAYVRAEQKKEQGERRRSAGGDIFLSNVRCSRKCHW